MKSNKKQTQKIEDKEKGKRHGDSKSIANSVGTWGQQWAKAEEIYWIHYRHRELYT